MKGFGHFTLACLVCLAGIVGAVPPDLSHPDASAVPEFQAPREGLRIQIGDTSTRVMVAKVNLTVGDMYAENGYLVGTYAIDVPMATSKNEHGAIYLNLNEPIADYMRHGGVLRGEGESFVRPKDQRLITCEVIPDPANPAVGKIKLAIDLGGRVLKFNSTYKIVGEDNSATSQVAPSPSDQRPG